jgi:glycosyltransferase involved in cell wall biosynthesis
MIQNLTSIIIPVKNESGNIVPIINGFKCFKHEIELIFVIGKSTDGTEEILANEALKTDALKIKLFFPKYEGKGNAVWAGFSIANGSIYAIFDGDLTVTHASLCAMIDKCKETGNVICGNRLITKNYSSFPRPNIYYNKIITFIFNKRFKTDINDILCGAKVLQSCTYDKILPFRNFFSNSDRWGDLEILSSASICGFTISNLNVDYLTRAYGVSKISILKDGSNFLFFLASTFFKRLSSPSK